MTTDITELAQRIPERKSHDWSQSVMHDCDFCNQWSLTVKHENGERICASCCDAEYTSKLEVANAELVEALEKAQAAERRWHRVASRIHEQACESDVKIDELEAIRAAAEKLVRCKGRYHSEQNYRALAALFGVNTPDLPPLDDESHAVTVENLQESAYRAGLTAGWNLGLANNNEGFNKCLAAHTAGFKVEAE